MIYSFISLPFCPDPDPDPQIYADPDPDPGRAKTCGSVRIRIRNPEICQGKYKIKSKFFLSLKLKNGIEKFYRTQENYGVLISKALRLYYRCEWQKDQPPEVREEKGNEKFLKQSSKMINFMYLLFLHVQF